MPQLGTGDPRVVGNYEIVSKLGEGGMGTVYKGRSRGGRSVAVKLAKPELAESPEFRLRFRTEIEAAQRVGGFHTAQVIDADPDGSPPWMVTAFIPGPTLGKAVMEDGPMPEPRLRALGAALAEALHAIHAHELIHRDLKPANIILAEDGPRVLDFGVARALQSSGVTNTRVSVGTPGFWAPEQVMNRHVGPPADVFALGAVLVFAAGGSAFGEGDSMALMYRALHEEPDLSAVPGTLQPLVASCLAKDPARRPTPDQLISLLATATGWTSTGLPAAPSAAGPGVGGRPRPAPGPGPVPGPVPSGRPEPSRWPEAGGWPEPAADDPRVSASPPPTVPPVPPQQRPGGRPDVPSAGEGAPVGSESPAAGSGVTGSAGRPPGADELPGAGRESAASRASGGAAAAQPGQSGEPTTFRRSWKARLLRGAPWVLLTVVPSLLMSQSAFFGVLLELACAALFLLAIRPFEVAFDRRGVRCKHGGTRVDYPWADVSQLEFPQRRLDGSSPLRLFVRSGANLPRQRPWLAVSAPHRHVTLKVRGKDFPYEEMREAASGLAPDSVVVSAP